MDALFKQYWDGLVSYPEFVMGMLDNFDESDLDMWFRRFGIANQEETNRLEKSLDKKTNLLDTLKKELEVFEKEKCFPPGFIQGYRMAMRSAILYLSRNL